MAAPATPTIAPTTDKPPRARRWIPLSMRIFAVMLVILGTVGVFWVGIPAYRQHVAIREIRRTGGYVNISARHDWLARIVGQERLGDFTDVFEVVARIPDEDSSFDDTVMPYVGDLGTVFSINLSDTPLTDAGLRHLGRLTGVEWLDLGGLNVSDIGIANIRVMRNLTDLNLDKTRVTDAGLAHLSRLTNLQVLMLDNTAVTDSGLAHLNGLTNLRRLSLYGTAVTDKGIEELKIALPDCEMHY